MDAYVLRGDAPRFEVLVLRRAPGGRNAGAWETVHGSVESGERPERAVLRELLEETGLTPLRLYNVSRVEAYYQHRTGEVALIPVFAAFVAADAAARVSSEHDRAEWLAPAAAMERLAWPRERRALEDVLALFCQGDGGLLDDVLRIC